MIKMYNLYFSKVFISIFAGKLLHGKYPPHPFFMPHQVATRSSWSIKTQTRRGNECTGEINNKQHYSAVYTIRANHDIFCKDCPHITYSVIS